MGMPQDMMLQAAGIDPKMQKINAENAALQQQLDLMKKQQDAMPKMPELESLLDPSTGLLKDQYQMKWAGDINPDMRGIEAFRDRALSTGPSSWATAALDKQKLEEQSLRDSTQQQGASAAAQARSGMASRYGLSPAAAERLAKSQMRNQMMGMQNVAMSGAKARADIGLQDEQMKNQFLQALPGQENALADIAFKNRQGQMGVDSTNIQGAIAQKSAADQAAMTKYQEQMKAYAANQNAQAMRESGSGGK